MQFDLSYVSLHSVSSVAQQKYVSVPMPAVSRPQSPGSLDLSILFRAPLWWEGKSQIHTSLQKNLSCPPPSRARRFASETAELIGSLRLK